MQKILSRIWTRIAEFISYDSLNYITNASTCVHVFIHRQISSNMISAQGFEYADVSPAEK